MVTKIGKAFYSLLTGESFGGVLLLSCSVAAMFIANSSFQHMYHEIIDARFGVYFRESFVGFSVHDFVNDVLMSLFFLMVGLEIKRELIFGELNDFSKAAFPAIAAVGGMLVPGLVYYLMNHGTPSINGFGIPMATDIAFALGVAMILGPRFPMPLKVFLVTLAVVDDLGAILVIAIFYSSGLNLFWLFVSGLVMLLLLFVNRAGVKSLSAYLLLGAFLWVSVHFSNIHATVSAVILAFFVPIKSAKGFDSFSKNLHKLGKRTQELNHDSGLLSDNHMSVLHFLKVQISNVENPLLKLEHALQPWCTYLIMPVFALANSGITISSDFNIDVDHILMGVVLGLLVGKPLGILLVTFLCEKIGIAKRPDGITWMYILCAGMFAGIGFTMSIFISNLAFSDNESRDLARVAVLIGSLLSCVFGVLSVTIYSAIRKPVSSS